MQYFAIALALCLPISAFAQSTDMLDPANPIGLTSPISPNNPSSYFSPANPNGLYATPSSTTDEIEVDISAAIRAVPLEDARAALEKFAPDVKSYQAFRIESRTKNAPAFAGRKSQVYQITVSGCDDQNCQPFDQIKVRANEDSVIPKHILATPLGQLLAICQKTVVGKVTVGISISDEKGEIGSVRVPLSQFLLRGVAVDLNSWSKGQPVVKHGSILFRPIGAQK